MRKLITEKIKSPTYTTDDGVKVFTSKFGREYSKKLSWLDRIFGVTNPCAEIEIPYFMGADCADFSNTDNHIVIMGAASGIGKTSTIQEFQRIRRIKRKSMEFDFEMPCDIKIIDYISEL